VGVLLKLTIIPFEDSENVQVSAPAGPPFVAQFNPESFTVNNEIELGPEESAHGDDGDEAKFKSIKPRTFSFDFLLDGTGTSGGEPRDVLASIELFKATVGFSGRIHRPTFLVLSWGSFIATCVVESYSVNYKLFRPDGSPLRAVLSTTFKEHKPKALKELMKNLSSPDVVHAHQVAGGDHLSLLSNQIYKDPDHYFEVAKFNELDSLRHIDVGATLYFPPLA
jgi:nucleoid-associated protein YgaU